jgi:hypothetical protein
MQKNQAKPHDFSYADDRVLNVFNEKALLFVLKLLQIFLHSKYWKRWGNFGTKSFEKIYSFATTSCI